MIAEELENRRMLAFDMSGVTVSLLDAQSAPAAELAGEPQVSTTNGDSSGLEFLNDDLIPPAWDPTNSNLNVAGAPSGADARDTSEYMVGKILAYVVLLESDGSFDPDYETWTLDEINDVKQEIHEGLTWWETTAQNYFPAMPLEFQVDWTFADTPFQTQYEPIIRPGIEAQGILGQELWIREFLAAQGSPTNPTTHVIHDVRTWNANLREGTDFDWTYTIFVVDSSNDPDGKFTDDMAAYAYRGGPFTVMTYDNGGWGIDEMGTVLAHETGHIFYALDEYPRSGTGADYTDTSGYYNTQNLNAWNGHPNPALRVDSIMAESERQRRAYTANISSPTSLEMIGWKDSDGDGLVDVVDVPMSLTGQMTFDRTTGTASFSGTSEVRALDNRNPMGSQNDITINRIDYVEYRVDDGAWVRGASLAGNDRETFSLDITIPAGSDTVSVRTVSSNTLVTSDVHTTRLDLSWPTAPLSGDDFQAHLFVNQDGDARLDGFSIDVANDVDGFGVFFADSGALTFETTGSTDTMVAFYDGPGAPDLENDDSGSGLNGRISTSVPEWSLLTLAVTGYDTTTGPYGLNVDGPAHQNTVDVTIDASRHGVATGSIDHEYDYEFFRFTTPAAGDWTVSVNPNTSWDPMLTVFDSSGNPMGGSFTSPIDGGGNGWSEQWTGNDLPSGQTYYLRVDGYDASSGQFTLAVQGSSSGDPNDQISEATMVSLGSTITGFSIDPGEDVDMFRFDVLSGQAIGFDADRSAGSELDSWIRLFNSSGDELSFNDDAAAPGEPPGVESYLEYTFQNGGTYYLGVSGYGNHGYSATSGDGDTAGSTGEYSLTINELTLFADPDDQLGEAIGTSVGSTESGFGIDPGEDVDMFSFSVSAGQQIGFDIDRAPGSVLDSWIRLFNNSGTELAHNDDGAAPGESNSYESYLEHTFSDAGTYYLGVSGYRNHAYNPGTGAGDTLGSSGEYVLSLTDLNVGADGNDQISEASSLSIGGVGSGAIQPGDDVDMWSISVAQDQTVGFDIDRDSGSELDSWLRLFDSSGNQLTHNDDASAPGEPQSYESYLEHTFSIGGTYYVGVSGYRNNAYNAVTGDGDVTGSTGGYLLRLTDLSANTDPDDQLGEAQSLSIGGSLTGSIDSAEDVDIFGFDVLSGQSVGFDVDQRSDNSLDSWLRLFDSSGSELDYNDDGGAPGEPASYESYLEYNFVVGGTYYLGVSGYRNHEYDPLTGRDDTAGSSGNYTLYLTDLGGSSDGDDQIGEAQAFSVGGLVTGDIDPGEDVDMFAFTVTAGQSVGIDIDQPAGSSLDSWIRLFNAGGNELLHNDDAAGPGEAQSFQSYLAVTFDVGGTYYLGVSGFGNSAYNAVTGGGDATGSHGAYELSIVDLSASSDDPYEDNDSASIVSGRPAGATHSPNLGLLTSRRQITGLAMQDAADWFRFEMDRPGTQADVVSLRFDHDLGDLDMAVYRSDGVTLVGSSTSSGDHEEVSLAGEAAGAFYVHVYGYSGASNDDYTLTIDPPTATSTGPQNYVVLFSGGGNEHNNHSRYYNNIRNLYSVLVNDLAVPRNHIYLLYADGEDDQNDLNLSDQLGTTQPVLTNSDMGFAQGSEIRSATLANLRLVMNNLAATVDGDDRFLFYSFDHGAGGNGQGFDRLQFQPSTTQDEVLTGWGENIRDDQLAPLLRSIDAGGRSYVFAQCFSGGMLDDLLPLAPNEFGMAATNHYEFSYGDGFAASFVNALDNGYVISDDVLVQTIQNDPFTADEPYLANEGTPLCASGLQPCVSSQQVQQEHPWGGGARFSILHPSTSPNPAPSPNAPFDSAASAPDPVQDLGGSPSIDTFESIPVSPLTVGQVVELTVTASDPDAGDVVEKVIFYLDANNDGVAENAETVFTDNNSADGWSMTWDTKSVPPATITLFAVAEDSTRLRSTPRPLIVTLEPSGNQTPVVETFFADPASPMAIGQRVTLTATASDLDPGDSVTKLSFYLDTDGNGFVDPTDELIAIDSNDSDGWRVAWDTKSYLPGSGTLLAVAEDEHGLRGTARQLPIVLYTPGDQEPSVTRLDANPASPITIGQVVQLTAETNDPDQGDIVSKVSFFRDGNGDGVPDPSERIGVDSNGFDGWHVQWDTKGSAPGSVSLLAVAQSPNLQESTPRSLTVELADLILNRPPAVSSFTTDADEPIEPGLTVTLQAQAGDLDPGDTVVGVAFYEDFNGNGIGDISQTIPELLGIDNDGSDGWSIPWDTTEHPDGIANLLVTAYDTSNAASEPFSISLEIATVTFDYGDAPAPYPVTLAEDGARHTPLGPRLGTDRDRESDGTHSVAADADDNSGANPDDEDGVSAIATMLATNLPTTSSVSVIVTADAKLDAWIDFNQNGSWLDAGERIAASLDVSSGLNVVGFEIPAGATIGDAAARFRISTDGGLEPTGEAIDGEVEDFLFSIVDGQQLPDVSVNMVHETSTLMTEAGSIRLQSENALLFEAPESNVGSMNLQGTSRGEEFNVNVGSLSGYGLSIAGAGGDDTLVLLGDGTAIDLTDPLVNMTDISTVDLSSDDAVTLTIDASVVANMSPVYRELSIRAGDGDRIVVSDSENWRLTEPVTRDGRFLLTANNSAAQGSESIECDVPHAWKNFLRAGDVDNNGTTTALDALLIINELMVRRFSDRDSKHAMDPLLVQEWPDRYFDHSGDDRITALDALRVINDMARIARVRPSGDIAPLPVPLTVGVPNTSDSWEPIVLSRDRSTATAFQGNLRDNEAGDLRGTEVQIAPPGDGQVLSQAVDEVLTDASVDWLLQLTELSAIR